MSGELPKTDRSVLVDRVTAIVTSSESCERLEEVIAALEHRQQLLGRALVIAAQPGLDVRMMIHLDVLEEGVVHNPYLQKMQDTFSIRACSGQRNFSDSKRLLRIEDQFGCSAFADPTLAPLMKCHSDFRPKMEIGTFVSGESVSILDALYGFEIDSLDSFFLTPNQIILLLEKNKNALQQQTLLFPILFGNSNEGVGTKMVLQIKFEEDCFFGLLLEFEQCFVGPGNLLFLPK